MNVLLVRSIVKPESVPDVDAAVDKLFSAIREAAPTGVRYASTKLADGVTYVALLQLDEGVENPLPGIAAFQEFQQALGDWTAEPPTLEQLTVLGTYRLFSD